MEGVLYTGTEGYGLVGWQLDKVISVVSFNLNDSLKYGEIRLLFCRGAAGLFCLETAE